MKILHHARHALLVIIMSDHHVFSDGCVNVCNVDCDGDEQQWLMNCTVCVRVIELNLISELRQ